MFPRSTRPTGLLAGIGASLLIGALASPDAALAQELDVAVTGLGGASGSPLGTLLRLLAALAIVLVAFWGCARLMRRLNGIGGGAHGGLRIVGGLSLGHRERLVVVQAGEEQLLLGLSAGRIERLHLLERPLAAASAASVGAARSGDPEGVPVAGASAASKALGVDGDGGDFRTRLLAAMHRQVRS